MSEWIPVSERLPEIEKAIIISCVGLQVYTGFRSNTEGYYYTHQDSYIESKNVIAWMPLPEPYKEVEND